ncbi:pantothenate synthetase [Roseimicrobium gellanilyticum]|uniref:Pantothenate synthetase n=1 Tax=Roseimicrobium gellanilyticum TaxID=748857 RepID=A0A366HBM7_9BACT|nr:pantoate--beta-alanine ligase [Roseimicrobium gellanilyticum]RBP39772.1 pantothenate synthetase [Roseimicrobium gellanilyticum]
MHVFHTVTDFRQWHAQSAGRPLVIVPTMGALHEGHLDLMREARTLAGDGGSVAVSIFVNPLQFGPKEDFAKYPRELEADSAKCASVGVDAIFAPSAEEVYAPDRSVIVLETKLSKVLCGASRPGHFDGVCTVVLKLFNIMQPDISVFGKKDYQQLAIIKRMVRDLNVPVEIVGSETVREADGLAMSSRNRYLSADERSQATALRAGLLKAKEAWQSGEKGGEKLKRLYLEVLKERAPLSRVDYIECTDADTLEPAEEVGSNGLMATAVFFGATRLIDNIELK